MGSGMFGPYHTQNKSVTCCGASTNSKSPERRDDKLVANLNKSNEQTQTKW